MPYKTTISDEKELLWILDTKIREIMIRSCNDDWGIKLIRLALDIKNAQNLERLAYKGVRFA